MLCPIAKFQAFLASWLIKQLDFYWTERQIVCPLTLNEKLKVHNSKRTGFLKGNLKVTYSLLDMSGPKNILLGVKLFELINGSNLKPIF